jgi:hypothetical protein
LQGIEVTVLEEEADRGKDVFRSQEDKGVKIAN